MQVPEIRFWVLEDDQIWYKKQKLDFRVHLRNQFPKPGFSGRTPQPKNPVFRVPKFITFNVTIDMYISVTYICEGRQQEYV